MELGSFAELIGSVASIVSVLVSVLAIKTANKAQKSADENAANFANSRIELERAHDEREKQRDQQQIASQIQAWWATKTTQNGLDWGIVLINANQGSVVHNVVVQQSGGRGGNLELSSLPPGTYFCESKPGGRWDFPKFVSSDDHLKPVSVGSNHTVNSIEFTDVLGKKWKWERERGVQIVQNFD